MMSAPRTGTSTRGGAPGLTCSSNEFLLEKSGLRCQLGGGSVTASLAKREDGGGSVMAVEFPLIPVPIPGNWYDELSKN